MGEPTKIIDLETKTKAKILVVDDEQDIASLIEDWLSDLFEVTVALNGKVAMHQAVLSQPQVALLDVVLPDMGGHDVVRLLKGAPQTKDIPVIVMAAKNFDESTIKMIKAEPNVFGFLYKPFKPSELVRMIEAALKRSSPSVSVEPEATRASSPSRSIESVGEISAPLEKDPISVSEPSFAGVTKSSKVPMKPKPAVRSRSEEDRPKGIMGRLTLTTLKVVLVGFVISGVFFGSAEWASRSAESALGTRFFVPPIYPASRFNEFLPYQWNNPKNTSPTYWEDGKAVYQFNQWGLRGQEFPLLPRPGVRRILLLGGSTVFGLGVRESDTLARRLEGRLNRERPGTYQVINAGLWALSPKEQWDYVKGQGLNFKPDVILWVCEARQEGEPSSEGLRWLGSHRWWVVPPLSESRWIQLLVHQKIRSRALSSESNYDDLFQEAEKLAREKKIMFHRWVWAREDADPMNSFLAQLADRLAPVVSPEKGDVK